MCRESALLALLIFLAAPGPAPQPTPVVRGVLFFSPACPHCHDVITRSLPPIVEQYGESLLIVAINTQSLEGQRLFRAAGEKYGIPPEQLGVPLLAVGDRALVGSFDIPNQLPGIIEEGLATGGIDWPEFAGLREALLAAGVEDVADTVPVPSRAVAEARTAEPAPQDTAATATTSVQPPELPAPGPTTPDLTAPEVAAAETTLNLPASAARRAIMDLAAAESRTRDMTPWQKFAQDRTGNSIAVLVLAGMIASVIAVLAVVLRRATIPRAPDRLVATLIALGLGVAGYLSYVEITQSLAVCGPVGDCNTVQQSAYARLLGVIPIGVLGVYGYLALGLGWLIRDAGPRRWNGRIAIALWGATLLGTLFSIYLTTLEPFVIGATCLWCVTSAIVMTLLLWAATAPAVDALGAPHTPDTPHRT